MTRELTISENDDQLTAAAKKLHAGYVRDGRDDITEEHCRLALFHFLDILTSAILSDPDWWTVGPYTPVATSWQNALDHARRGDW